MLNRLYERILNCSSIDYPRPDLEPLIWQKEDDNYFLRPEVKDKILKLLDQYPNEDLLQEAREIRIVGSIGSNLYIDDTDIDLHIVPEDLSQWNEERVQKVKRWFAENELDKWIGEHEIEVYVQAEPQQDLLSVSLYNVLEDTWVVGPKIVPLNYDPYEEFSHLQDDLRTAFEEADLTAAELRRDIIDYDTIKKAMEKLPGETKRRLLQKLRNKLDEIEKGVERLYKERGELVDIRFKRGTSEEAMKDVELAKKWEDANAIFKFSDRYNYLRAIGDLEKLLQDDGEITPDEIDLIRGVVGHV